MIRDLAAGRAGSAWRRREPPDAARDGLGDWNQVTSTRINMLATGKGVTGAVIKPLELVD